MLTLLIRNNSWRKTAAMYRPIINSFSFAVLLSSKHNTDSYYIHTAARDTFSPERGAGLWTRVWNLLLRAAGVTFIKWQAKSVVSITYFHWSNVCFLSAGFPGNEALRHIAPYHTIELSPRFELPGPASMLGTTDTSKTLFPKAGPDNDRPAISICFPFEAILPDFYFNERALRKLQHRVFSFGKHLLSHRLKSCDGIFSAARWR